MASQPVKPSIRVQGQRIWWAHDHTVFCGLCLYSQTAFYLGNRKECQTRSLYWFNESCYTIYLAGCLWVPRHSALQNRIRSCTVGWCLFWLRNSSSLQLFVFLCLFSTTVWAPVSQSLQNFETMMILWFAIFLNSVAQLVWTVQVLFQRTSFLATTRALRISLPQWIPQLNSNVVLLSAQFRARLSR